jgi:hypothetical protein
MLIIFIKKEMSVMDLECKLGQMVLDMKVFVKLDYYLVYNFKK